MLWSSFIVSRLISSFNTFIGILHIKFISGIVQSIYHLSKFNTSSQYLSLWDEDNIQEPADLFELRLILSIKPLNPYPQRL